MPECSIVKHLTPDRQRPRAKQGAGPAGSHYPESVAANREWLRSCKWRSVVEDGELGGVAEPFVGGFEVADGAERLDRAFGVVEEHRRPEPGHPGSEKDALLAAGMDVAVAFGGVDEDHVP